MITIYSRIIHYVLHIDKQVTYPSISFKMETIMKLRQEGKLYENGDCN